MLLWAFVIGAAITLFALVVREAIKAWRPHAAGPSVDRVFDAFMRWFFRALSIAFVGTLIALIWIVFVADKK